LFSAENAEIKARLETLERVIKERPYLPAYTVPAKSKGLFNKQPSGASRLRAGPRLLTVKLCVGGRS